MCEDQKRPRCRWLGPTNGRFIERRAKRTKEPSERRSNRPISVSLQMSLVLSSYKSLLLLLLLLLLPLLSEPSPKKNTPAASTSEHRKLLCDEFTSPGGYRVPGYPKNGGCGPASQPQRGASNCSQILRPCRCCGLRVASKARQPRSAETLEPQEA